MPASALVRSWIDTLLRWKGRIALAVLLLTVASSIALYLYFRNAEVQRLQIHSVYKATDPLFDIVFIHGLDGNWKTTWQSRRSSEAPFWPESLGKRRQNANVWSVGYDAASSEWLSDPLPIQDRADSILDLLTTHGLGTRPIVFITHSLGGLVTKNLLRRASDHPADKRWGTILKQTRMVAFFGTPHSGSDLSGIIGNLEKAGFNYRSTGLVLQMRKNDAGLRDLNDWYKSNIPVRGTYTLLFRESKSIHGIKVVDEVQSDIGLTNVRPRFVEDDHIGMCKLEPDDTTYLWLNQQLDDLVAELGDGPKGAWRKVDISKFARGDTVIGPDDLGAIKSLFLEDQAPLEPSQRAAVDKARSANGYAPPISDRIAFVSPRLFSNVDSLHFPAIDKNEARAFAWIVRCDPQFGATVLQKHLDLSESVVVQIDRKEWLGVVRCIVFLFPVSESGHKSFDVPEMSEPPRVP